MDFGWTAIAAAILCGALGALLNQAFAFLRAWQRENHDHQINRDTLRVDELVKRVAQLRTEQDELREAHRRCVESEAVLRGKVEVLTEHVAALRGKSEA